MVRPREARSRRSLPWLLGLGVLSLLGAFLALQVRWLGELAEAQLELTPRYLETAAGRSGRTASTPTAWRSCRHGRGDALYRSHAFDERDREAPDASAELWLGGNSWRSADTDALGWIAEDGLTWFFDEEAAPALLARMDAPWRIELRHRDGPLAVVLDRARTRNLLLAGWRRRSWPSSPACRTSCARPWPSCARPPRISAAGSCARRSRWRSTAG